MEEVITFRELVTVEITRVDYEILNRIAKHDNISIAHALTLQWSGQGFYDDWIKEEVNGKVVLKDTLAGREGGQD